jgi:cytochrome c peroxidase
VNPDGRDYIDPGLAGFLETTEWAAMADANFGKHKTPTLRNVDKRPSPGFVKAYGHNGYFKSLESIVHFYNTRDELPRCADPFTTEADALEQNCWPEPEVSENLSTNAMGSLGLNAAEEAAIVAFMKTLTDDSTMGLRQRMGESPGPGPAGPPESGSGDSGTSGPRGSGGKH